MANRNFRKNLLLALSCLGAFSEAGNPPISAMESVQNDDDTKNEQLSKILNECEELFDGISRLAKCEFRNSIGLVCLEEDLCTLEKNRHFSKNITDTIRLLRIQRGIDYAINKAKENNEDTLEKLHKLWDLGATIPYYTERVARDAIEEGWKYCEEIKNLNMPNDHLSKINKLRLCHYIAQTSLWCVRYYEQGARNRNLHPTPNKKILLFGDKVIRNLLEGIKNLKNLWETNFCEHKDYKYVADILTKFEEDTLGFLGSNPKLWLAETKKLNYLRAYKDLFELTEKTQKELHQIGQKENTKEG